MMKIKKLKLAERRAVSVFLFFAVIMTALTGRIAYIQKSPLSEVSDMQFNRELILGETRGYIYDINMKPLVNSEKIHKTVFVDCPINKTVTKDNKTEELNGGLYVAETEENQYYDSKYLKNYYEYRRYENKIHCPHIIGYLDSSGEGVCGIEKAFDGLLKKSSGNLVLSFSNNGRGNTLPADGISLTDNNYNSPAGISLTIDKNIQEITEAAVYNSGIECGAAVVMNVSDGKIAASVSVPEFDIKNLEAAIASPLKPFVNRAFSAYPVGSVFKPFVAAAAIKNGFDPDALFDCTGYISVGENSFGCYNGKAHGKETLNEAIENSCNTFFIDAAIKTGKEEITAVASAFGFGRETVFCSSLISAKGNLPASDEITSDSELANISFGQGQLLATPVQICAAYSTLAAGGIYKEPSLLSKLTDENGEDFGYYKSEYSVKAAEEGVCRKINTCLHNNMTEGTGKSGRPENVSAAGKTATAQTGRYIGSREQVCTWFAGFFPYENPRYAVAVFNENGTTPSSDCAPAFREIAEKVTALTESRLSDF